MNRPGPDETPLPGGLVGGAVRVGDTVRRPTGPWSPAVHALLRHLEAAGLRGVPRLLGTDATGREILSFLPGRAIDVDDEIAPDDVLVAAVRWLRDYHDAVRGFRPPGVVRWRNVERALADDEIVCHHDPGAYNWIVDEGRFAGVVDWDMAGPGRPIDDLAFMAWNSVPLFRDVGTDPTARRVRLMATTYGDVDGAGPLDLLHHVDARMTAATDRIEAGQHEGDPGMLNLGRAGEPARTRARLTALHERLPAIRALL